MLAGHHRRVKFSLRTNLEAHYDFEDGAGSTVSDVSGNSHDGTAVGGMAWDAGKVGQYSGDMVGDYITTDNHADLNTNSMSMSVWLKPDADATNHIFCRADSSITTKYLAIIIGPATGSLTDELITISKNNSVPFDRLGYTTATRTELFNGNWHHLTITADGTEYKIYLDGESKTVSVGDGDNNGDSAVTGYDACNIGRLPASTPLGSYSGGMDDMHLHSRALTAPEIYELSIRE